MRRGADDWWTPVEPTPDVSAGEVDYGYLVDDAETPVPDPRSRRQPDGRARAVPHVRPDGVRLDRPGLDRPPARRLGDLRAARRHVHPRGHARRGAGEAGPPARDRRRLRRAAAGQRGQRHAQLGLRRRAVVRRPRAVRRPRGVPALRRRLPRGRARRDPGRRLQPPRPVGQLPADVRAVPQVRRQHLGRPGQPRRRGQRRGAPLHPRQRADVAAATSTSTGCGSTPCTPSPTPPRCTCWRRWRSRSPRCPPTSAGR